MGIVDKAERRYMQYVDREKNIVNAAIKVFGAKSFGSATISMIAKEAGITEATIYKHFAGKRALYEACWQEVKKQVSLHSAEGSVGSSNNIEGILRNEFRFVREAPEAAAFVLQLASVADDPELREFVKEAMGERIAKITEVLDSIKAKSALENKTDTHMLSIILLGFSHFLAGARHLGFEDWVKEEEAVAFFQSLTEPRSKASK